MVDVIVIKEKTYEIKLGRWVYCKYCCKNVRPTVGDGIVKCSECGYGLAPLDAVIEAGSYKKWYEKICHNYAQSVNDSESERR